MTLQLFEYLLAAQKSNLSIHYNLNKYPAYWFLDEVLSFKHVKLESVGNRISIQLEEPASAAQEIEISAPLAALLETLERDSVAQEQILVSTEEFEKTLHLEIEAVMSKLGYQDQGIIIVNDWQQILLGVSQSKVSLTEQIPREEDLKSMAMKLVQEYRAWQDAVKAKKSVQAQLVKEKAFYDEILTLYSDPNVDKQMSLGVGLLHIPGRSSVYHPLLMIDIEVFVEPSKGQCEFVFEKQTLTVDAVLEQVLFSDAMDISSLQAEIDQMYIDPFNESAIAIALKKIIKHIHPEGNYFASPVDALLAPEDVPQVLQRSVLFIKEEESFNGEDKLKPTIEYLSKDNITSDVIGSIISPDFVMNAKRQSKDFSDKFIEPVFDWQADSPERKILTYLQEHPAVAVLEEAQTDKRAVVANLIIYLIAAGNRVLVMGENEVELDEVRALLAPYLTEIHHKIPTKKADYKRLKEALIGLREKIESYSISQIEVDKVWDEFEACKRQLDEVVDQMIAYRLCASKEVSWQESMYHPAALAKLVSELDEEERLAVDSVPFDMTFEISDEEIERFWELRPHFTPENMTLLNYDFIDLNALNDHPEYQKMLELEGRYLKLSEEVDDRLKGIFDERTDIRFLQYLFDQLPELILDVSKIDTVYGDRVLRRALASFESYRELTKVLKDVNEAIANVESNEVPTDEKKVYIQLLNEMLEIATADLLLLDIQDSKQLIDFYVLRRAEMMRSMDVAQLILIFNEGATALSSTFAGITSDKVGKMDGLYKAAALHLSKVEFEICWLRVKSHFIRIYQPIIHQEHVHPVCLQLFEALQSDDIDKFKEILAEIVDLIGRRQAFVTFGEFIDQISSVMPEFTTSIMSQRGANDVVAPNFKEAFAQGQLYEFFEQLQACDPAFLEQEISRLKDQLLKLQSELLEIECWRKLELIDTDVLANTIQILEGERPTGEKVDRNLMMLSRVIFMPLRENNVNKNLEPDFFDVSIFVDASSSNIIRMSELVHSHKAVLFGNEQEQPLIPLQLREDDDQKLKDRFGENLQKFGELYFRTSLFDLMVNSAAWETQVKLPVPMRETISKYVTEVDGMIPEQWLTETHQEIFDTLVKMGYDLKCNVEIENHHFDFLILGQSNKLMLNILGIAQTSREKIEKQLKKELELRHQGVDIHTIQSVQFQLDSHKTLLDLYDRLERLSIYPSKNK